MVFNVYDLGVEKKGTKENTDFSEYKTKKYTDEELLMVKHNEPINTCPNAVFDVSDYTEDDIVLLIDGDWLTFSATSNEMERFITCNIDGECIEFSGYNKYKEYLKSLGRVDEYSVENCIKGQRNKELFISLGNIKRKVGSLIEKTKANKVIIALGCIDNKRLYLPLPKYKGRYKAQRGSEWIPETLPEAKEWTRKKWVSWWSVGKETDDDVTIIFHSLLDKGVKVYLCGIDKDYNQEHYGGLYLIGHHEEPTWYDNTEENALGFLKLVDREVIDRKTKKGSGKYTSDVKGHGDMFLAYQILSEDSADNYSGKSFLKEFGDKKTFSDKEVVKLLSKCKSRKELWQTVFDTFKKHLPESFEYISWDDKVIKSSPLHAVDLFYKCACMMKHQGFEANIVDLFDELGVDYD